MIATLERQLQQQEATEVAVAQQEAQAPDVGAQQQDEQQAQQQAQLQSFESASSSLVSGSRSSSNNSLAQQQGSVICQQCRGRRPLLRRPSPVHHPALLEAKTQRRLAGPHPSFDEEALQHDPDGAAGKAWRQRKKAEAVEARRRAQREAERQCECNGF